MASLEDQQALLLYRVGPVLCCSPSYTVLSIIQPVPLTHPPGTDAARPGIFRHSGHVVKTEELRVRFGVEDADRKPGRMIIAEVDSGRTAFWVDDIIDVISMPGKGWGKLPSHLPRGIFSRTLLLEDKIYLYADFDALQYLQGHGLLKSYIEQLLQEKTTTPRQPTSTKTATPTTMVISKPADTSSVAVNITAVRNTAPATPTEQPQTKIEIPKSKESVVLKKAAPIEAANIAPSTMEKPVLQTSSTSRHVDKTASEPRATSVKKKPDAPETIKPFQQAAIAREITAHNATPTIIKEDQKTAPINKTSSPTSTAKRNQTKQTQETEKSDRFPWSVVIMILLLLSGSSTAIYYYLQDSVERTSKTYDTQATTPAETTKQSTPVTLPIEATAVMETPVAIESKPVKESIPVADASRPIISTTDTTAESPTPDYQASIQKDDEGITIVIKAPKEEKILKEEFIAAETNIEAPTTEPLVNTSTPAEAIEEKSPVAKQPQREEILHIVVKGDTLWHIARHYVNNPFRYPELARLSNIKNPDLIYPGNRVRIVREFK